MAAGALSLAAAAPVEAARPTGRHLVTFERASTAAVVLRLSAVLSSTGVRRPGRGVPALGIATVRGLVRRHRPPAARPRRAQRLGGVGARPAPRAERPRAGDCRDRVHRRACRRARPIQWALARQGFPRAWDVTTGAGAIVGALDTGVDGGNPELAGKIASADAAGTADPLTRRGRPRHAHRRPGLRGHRQRDRGGRRGLRAAGWRWSSSAPRSPAASATRTSWTASGSPPTAAPTRST